MSLLTTRERILPNTPQYAEPVDRNFGELWRVINGNIGADNIANNSITGGATGELALATITDENIALDTITLQRLAASATGAAANVGSLRKLGTGALEAAAGNHTHPNAVAFTAFASGDFGGSTTAYWGSHATFTAGYEKTADGMVVLSGHVKGGTAISSNQILTLPVGVRPRTNGGASRFIVGGITDGGSDVWVNLRITDAGTITIMGYQGAASPIYTDFNATGSISLDSIQFMAA